MSPFSQTLLNLRLKHDFRQREMAEMLGYEQSYISALEIGAKSQPNQDFMDRLVQAFQLSVEDAEQLMAAYRASERKLSIAPDSPEELFWLLDDLRQMVACLSLEEVQVLRGVLRIRGQDSRMPRTTSRRPRRLITEGSAM